MNTFALIVLRARGVHFDLRQNSATKTMVLLTRSGAFIGTNVHTMRPDKGFFCGPTLQKSVLKLSPCTDSCFALLSCYIFRIIIVNKKETNYYNYTIIVSYIRVYTFFVNINLIIRYNRYK